MRLTDSLIKKIKPNDRYQDYSDEGSPLSLRVKADGTRLFIWRGRLGGKQTKKVLGEWPAMNITEARSAALAMKAEAKTVKPALPVHQHHKPRIMTMQKAFDRYMREKGDGMASGSQIKGQMNLRILPKFGDREIGSIKREEINDHFNELRAFYPGAGINRVLAQFKAFMNWCLDECLIEHNPASRIKMKVREKPRERVLEAHELGYLQQAIHEITDYDKPLMLLLHTVTRRSDIFNLRWHEVFDFDDRIELRIGNTKGDIPHVIFLTPSATKYLPARPDDAKDSDFVFPSISKTRGGFLLRQLRKLTGEKAAKAKRQIEHFTIHDFRTAATTFLAAERELERVSFSDAALEVLLAHKLTGVTNRHYNKHRYARDRQSMLAHWSQHLDAELAKVVKGAEK